MNKISAELNENTTKTNELMTPVDDTLMANIERIIAIAEFTKMDKSFACMAQPYADFVAEKLKMTFDEVVFFSLLMNMVGQNSSDASDIAGRIGCNTIRVLKYVGVANALKRRHVIKIENSYNDTQEYRVTKNAITLVTENKSFENAIKELTADQLYDEICSVFDEFDDEHDTYMLHNELDSLFKDNMHLQFCKNFSEYWTTLDYPEGIILLLMCIRFMVNEKDETSEDNWDGFITRSEKMSFRNDLRYEFTDLQQRGLAETLISNGMRDVTGLQLTREAKERLFAGMNLNLAYTRNQGSEVLPYSGFTPKQLFYSAQDAKRIDTVSQMLQPERFNEIVKRMEEQGLRKGFACLFYGAPGTGKTETVYQLARQTQRDVFTIDVSKIRNCLVGETEKNITDAFRRYKKLVRQSTNAPILLFNEADSVLGIRYEGAQKAVDRMENSVQNIILQEMENLEGIMIATTNLTQNLDKAFERRFVYKVEFHKPDVKAKAAIWKSLIPDLKPETAEELAESYDFSGGQIENVARKRSVDIILKGAEPTILQMHEYCRDEIISNVNANAKRIGFGA